MGFVWYLCGWLGARVGAGIRGALSGWFREVSLGSGDQQGLFFSFYKKNKQKKSPALCMMQQSGNPDMMLCPEGH